MRTEQKKKKNTWLKITGIILLVLIVGGGVYAYNVYNSLKTAVETMHEPIEQTQSDKRDEPVAVKDKDPFSVLMLGVDERAGDRGRSDTMIVLTINPNNNSVKMLSIPRDTRTEIVKAHKIKLIMPMLSVACKPTRQFLYIGLQYH